MSALTDPREQAGCACPRLDGHDCYRFRNHIEFGDYSDDGGPCICYCHELYEGELLDEVDG